MSKFAPLVLALLFFSALSSRSEVCAFGYRAHVIATRIAEEHLEPEAKKEVFALLKAAKGEISGTFDKANAFNQRLIEGVGPIENDFVRAAIWADVYRGRNRRTSPWHYVNVPLGEERYDDKYDPDGKHIISKIERFLDVLKDKTRPNKERGVALLFLVHFVEDLHMPLHVASNDDKGGNDVRISFFVEGMPKRVSTSLHGLWDYALLESIGRDTKKLGMHVSRLATEENRQKWMRGTPRDWAAESIVLAEPAYQHPVLGRIIQSGDRLGARYQEAFLEKKVERICQAGLRLAFLLNEVFRQEG